MTDDALLSSPARSSLFEATGHYGAAYGDPMQHFGTGGPVYHDEFHHHYQQLRREHERQLDEDYQAWRRHRFGDEFNHWRRSRQEPAAPRDDGPLQSLGRAVSETVTGADDEHRAPQRVETERFFERS